MYEVIHNPNETIINIISPYRSNNSINKPINKTNRTNISDDRIVKEVEKMNEINNTGKLGNFSAELLMKMALIKLIKWELKNW